MSQYSFGNLESPVSGTVLVNTHLEPWRDAMHSLHSGSSRPSYAVAHMMWLDTTTTPWILKVFDGSDDISIGTINSSTNVFTPSGLVLNNSTTSAPTVNDDSADGYTVGSKWINTSTDLIYEAVDVTVGAAVWKQIIDTDSTQTLSGKTLTNPIINAASGTIILPQGTSPAQTAEGSILWDTDDDVLTVGTASGRKTMCDTNSTQSLSGKTLSDCTASNTTAAATNVGYLGTPQNLSLDSADYTLVLGDAGKAIDKTTNTARALTIPANSSVAFGVGTIITGSNEGTGALTINITTDTLRWGSLTGSRTVPQHGNWSIRKITTTIWRMTGSLIT